MLLLMPGVNCKKKETIVLLLCLLVLASCRGQVKSNRYANVNSIQAVLKHIRSDTSSHWSSYHNVRQLSKQLNLESVEAGFDSIQIRVWFDYSLAWKKHLVVIEQQCNKWSGRLYEMKVGYVDTLNFNLVEHFEKKVIEPGSGWKQFISDLDQFKIRELSDSSKTGLDGTTYCVEIVTHGTYTYYDFWEPTSSMDKNWQAANMVKIIALLEREFKFTSLKSK